ncbi:MAG: carbon-nitrogen family hydrolase [Spirochaetales bacterium]|nr:MAG: carbon-nitrogen family hydrolase [Spirochaetales bacterium]
MQFIFAGIQMNIRNCDALFNLDHALDMVAEAAARGARLVCLPEMFLSGFDYSCIAACAEPIPGPVTSRLSSASAKAGIYLLAGSMPEKTDTGLYNTSVLFDPEGAIIHRVRKIHLFPLMDETRHFLPGKETGIISTGLGTLGVFICYDLRFPELGRTLAVQGAEILLVPAQFPHPRLDHWRVLLQARAVENQVFVMGVNRVGNDGNNRFFGHTSVYDPWGELVAGSGEGEGIVYADIDTAKVEEVRRKIPCLSGRKPEVYNLS